MKIPKMSIKNSGNSIENSFGEDRMPLRHKKVGSPEVNCKCVMLKGRKFVQLNEQHLLGLPDCAYAYSDTFILIYYHTPSFLNDIIDNGIKYKIL